MAKKPAPAKIPGTYKTFIQKYPALGKAHEQVASAALAAGPSTKNSANSSRSASRWARAWSPR